MDVCGILHAGEEVIGGGAQPPNWMAGWQLQVIMTSKMPKKTFAGELDSHSFYNPKGWRLGNEIAKKTTPYERNTKLAQNQPTYSNTMDKNDKTAEKPWPFPNTQQREIAWHRITRFQVFITVHRCYLIVVEAKPFCCHSSRIVAAEGVGGGRGGKRPRSKQRKRCFCTNSAAHWIPVGFPVRPISPQNSIEIPISELENVTSRILKHLTLQYNK